MDLNCISLSERSVAQYPPGATLGPRKQLSYEFVWIVAGNCNFIIDGKNYNAPPDSVFLLCPGEMIYFEWDKDAPTIHGYIHFTVDKKIPELPPPILWPKVIYLDEKEDILRPLLRYSVNIPIQTNDAAKHILDKINLLEILLVYVNGWQHFEKMGLPSNNPIINTLYRSILHLLESNQQDKITLSNLADQVGVSSEHLCRLTRKILRVTPMDLIYKLKIEKACRMLARTDLSLKEIAWLSGFSDIYHFSKRFKKQTGYPPGEYRQLAHFGRVVPHSDPIRKNA